MMRSRRGLAYSAGTFLVGAIAVWLLLPRDSKPTGGDVMPTWADLQPELADPGTLIGFDIWAGALAPAAKPIHVSTRFNKPLSPSSALTRALPFVSPPSNGRVAFGFFDGVKSELHVLNISSGTDSLVASEAVVFHAAALDERGTAYVVALDIESREELGIFEVREEPPWKKLIEPRDLPFRALVGSALYLPRNGGTVLSVDCTFSDCTARLYSLETGAQIGARVLSGGVIGVAERAIGVQVLCSACAHELIGLPSLEAAPIGRSCGPAALATYAGMPALVSGSAGDCSADGDELIAQWPNRGRATVGVPTLSGYVLFQQLRRSVAALPDGWVLLTEDGSLGTSGKAALFDINTGRIVETEITH